MLLTGWAGILFISRATSPGLAQQNDLEVNGEEACNQNLSVLTAVSLRGRPYLLLALETSLIHVSSAPLVCLPRLSGREGIIVFFLLFWLVSGQAYRKDTGVGPGSTLYTCWFNSSNLVRSATFPPMPGISAPGILSSSLFLKRHV